jgi:hypothetical protein
VVGSQYPQEAVEQVPVLGGGLLVMPGHAQPVGARGQPVRWWPLPVPGVLSEIFRFSVRDALSPAVG